MQLEMQVDSYRFLSGITKRLVKTWIGLEGPGPIPWTSPTKPLSECTVALISTAGIALKNDRPFDQEGERRNPWWGDPTYRVLPHTANTDDIQLYHLHVDPTYAYQDINCLLPIQRLNELAQAGKVGSTSPRAYSIMGYILEPTSLLEETTPAIINDLRADMADIIVLVPA